MFGFGGFGSFYPYYGYYPYYPYYPYYSGDSYYPPAPAASYDNDNSGQLANEVQRLSGEVEDLKNNGYSRSEGRTEDRYSGSMSAKEPTAVTTFVFHDGRRIDAQNYAITGQTLWIFTEHTSRRFALADLDVAVTEKTNSKNGIEFHLPEPRH